MIKPTLNLRTKILLFILGITLATVAAMVMIVLFSIRPQLEAKLEKRGSSIAHAISSQCINPILTRKLFQLDMLFREFIAGEPGVEYIYVLAHDGAVTAHSFGSGFPVELKKLEPLIDRQGHGSARFLAGDSEIVDISVPILDGQLGRLHVGMAVAPIKTDIKEILTSFSGIALLFSLSSLLIFVFLERRIIRPILEIRAVSAQIGEGELERRALVKSGDEIGALAAEFNRMLDALREIRAKIVQENKLLAESEERFRQLNMTLEERVKERTAELSASNRELESFIYSVSHEMRAPIARMEGFSEMLAEIATEGEQHHIAARIAVASRRMRDVIDALLTLSRLSRAECIPEMVDLSALARRIVKELSLAATHSPRVSIAEGIAATGDRKMLELCLRNLLGNAFKYTAKTAAPEISFSATEAEGETVYTVRDNGVGFDMTDTSNLFEPFVRFHEQKEFVGDGIGLAIVHRIIERHAGRIWAEAAPHKGAAFHFTLGS